MWLQAQTEGIPSGVITRGCGPGVSVSGALVPDAQTVDGGRAQTLGEMGPELGQVARPR